MKNFVEMSEGRENVIGSGLLQGPAFLQDVYHFCYFFFNARILVSIRKFFSCFTDPPQLENKCLESLPQLCNRSQRLVGVPSCAVDSFLNLADGSPPRFLIHGWGSPREE